jgi:hypothetical protein
MKPMLSRVQKRAATAAVLGLATAIPALTQTLPRNTMRLERGADGAPCQAEKKYPYGTWEISVLRGYGEVVSTNPADGDLSRQALEQVVSGSSACTHAVPGKVAWGWEA